MRIIPRNTKVATEFFTGVSLSDIIVGAVGVLMLFFVVISNLPYKAMICGVILSIFVLLLVRIDTEANYMFLFRIVKHFSYYRHYQKIRRSPFEEAAGEIPAGYEMGEHALKKKNKDKKTMVQFFLKEEKKKDEGATQA